MRKSSTSWAFSIANGQNCGGEGKTSRTTTPDHQPAAGGTGHSGVSAFSLATCDTSALGIHSMYYANTQECHLHGNKTSNVDAAKNTFPQLRLPPLGRFHCSNRTQVVYPSVHPSVGSETCYLCIEILKLMTSNANGYPQDSSFS